MAPAWLLLIALACSALAQVSADCGKCATEECVSGGEGWARFKKCVCVPSLENCQGGTPITNISTQIQKAERCIDSVYSCALDEIKGYLPNLDTQICDTAESQRKFEEGDWKAYYGPRVWDSEALGTIIGLFFPATSALAAAKLVRVLARMRCGLSHVRRAAAQRQHLQQDDELNKQVQGLEHALDTALDDAQDQARPRALGAMPPCAPGALSTLLSPAGATRHSMHPLCTACTTHTCFLADGAQCTS